MRTIRTPENRALFLEELSKCGNVTHSAVNAGIARVTVYEWRQADPVFAEDWDKAVELGTEGLEDEARRRALGGSDLLMIFMLKALKPEKFKDRNQLSVDVTGNISVGKRVSLDELRNELRELMGIAEQDRSNVIDMRALPRPDESD